MNRNKRILTGLNHAQYEHPFDKKALGLLESAEFKQLDYEAMNKVIKYVSIADA